MSLGEEEELRSLEEAGMIRVYVRRTSRALELWENRRLVTDEPVKSEKSPVGVRYLRRFTDHFGGIYRIYLIMNQSKTGRRQHVTTGWT